MCICVHYFACVCMYSTYMCANVQDIVYVHICTSHHLLLPGAAISIVLSAATTRPVVGSTLSPDCRK